MVVNVHFPRPSVPCAIRAAHYGLDMTDVITLTPLRILTRSSSSRPKDTLRVELSPAPILGASATGALMLKETGFI